MKMGADHYIATLEEGDWGEKYFDTFDLIVVCCFLLPTDIDFNIMPKAMKNCLNLSYQNNTKCYR
ncbi:alcohol dehydrogenase [Fusarium falciforme]|nr:alcohol dehydrogenase [Fusarium falciforme]